MAPLFDQFLKVGFESRLAQPLPRFRFFAVVEKDFQDLNQI
jgi:hypothetical protein